MRKRWLQIMAAAGLAAALLSGCGGKDAAEETGQDAQEQAVPEEQGELEEQGEPGGQGEPEEPEDIWDGYAQDGSSLPRRLTLWYTQSELSDYFLQAAEQFSMEYGIEVQLEQVSGVDYIESIYQASVEDGAFPDLYVTTTDMLEKAKLAGLTVPAEGIGQGQGLPQKAVDAVTYQGEQVAYPFYSDTSVLVYNTAYVQSAPATVEDIKTFSETFEGDGKVQNIFAWNVNDIFLNYFVIGNYVNLGGPYGDDSSQIVVNSEQIQAGMTYFQQLSDFFALDETTASEEKIVQDFVSGSTIYAIIRDDSIGVLEEAAAQTGLGYGVAQIPDMSAELVSRPLSITHSVVVNGYSHAPGAAARLAQFVTQDYAGQLYELSGNVTVCSGTEFSNPQLAQAQAQYGEALEVSKIIQTSSYWLQMEPVFMDIWNGEDVAARMGAAESAILASMGIAAGESGA